MSSFTLSSPRVANYQTSASALRMLIKLMAIIAVATTIAALLGGCASRQAISTDYGSPFSMRGELLAREQPSSLLAVPVDDNAGLKTVPSTTQAAISPWSLKKWGSGLGEGRHRRAHAKAAAIRPQIATVVRMEPRLVSSAMGRSVRSFSCNL
jgi:hypothetical protein